MNWWVESTKRFYNSKLYWTLCYFKHDKIILLAKSKLNDIKVFISKALINSNISHDEFVLINVLKEYGEMKEEIKNVNNCLLDLGPDSLSKILVYL